MGNLKPFIGVTPWYDYEQGTTYIKNGYLEGIHEAGGVGVLLPMVTDESFLDEMMEKFDGFLFTGGQDLDAKYFGEYNMPCNGKISPYRDAMEMHMARRAIQRNKPILGICRGIQVMNVAMGGSIYQDIYSQVKDREVIQHSQDAPKWYPTHEIRIEKNSKIEEAFQQEKIEVNSFHHQSVKDLAPGFVVSAYALDGIIEAIEHKNHPFAVGVQWHPELMWQKDKKMIKIFKLFVNSMNK